MKTRDIAFTAIMLFIDIAGVMTAAFIVLFVFILTDARSVSVLKSMAVFRQEFIVIIIAIYILFFFYEEIYPNRSSFWNEFVCINKASFFGSLVLMLFCSYAYPHYPQRYLFPWAMFLALIILVPVFHLLGKAFVFKIKYFKKKVIIVANSELNGFVDTVKKRWYSGYKIIGVIGKRLTQHPEVPLLGELAAINNVMKKHRVDIAVINESEFTTKKLDSLIHCIENVVQSIVLIPDIKLIKTLSLRPDHVNETLLFHISNDLAVTSNRVLKNIIDFAIALFVLVLLFPFLVIFAFLIKLDSAGPVFHAQERIGKNGKTFNMIKFRSMYHDGDKRLADFLEKNPDRKNEWNQFQKLRSDDPRVTRVGRLIRRFSIDELPQIINVLFGHMSIVGPRPYLPREKNEIGKYASIITKIKPGLTGLWQVRGRSDLAFAARLKLDEYYIRNWSFLLDYIIIAQTIKVVLNGKGAY